MFRFTIRDVLWLMMVVGICVILSLTRSRMRGEIRGLQGAMLKQEIENIRLQAEVALHKEQLRIMRDEADAARDEIKSLKRSGN